MAGKRQMLHMRPAMRLGVASMAALALLASTAAPAIAEKAKPADKTDRTAPAKPVGPAAPDPGAAKPPEQPKAPLGPPPPPDWSEREIRDATAECAKLLRGLPLSFEALPPIRDGACGAPAPVSLKGLATVPGVEIAPAATVSCKMAAALHRWFMDYVQPRAKELLHANVVRVTNVASYHCRNRYNDPFQRISNHAYAEALDISEFLTAKGERVNVLEHWPMTGDARSQFLKDVHAGACKIFGTVLGPEANEAHRNHFHFDMAERRKPLCDHYGGKPKTAGDNPQSQPPAPAPAPPPAARQSRR